MHHRPIDGEALDRVKRLLDQDLKLDAIKVYRDATGASVDEAETAIKTLDGDGPPVPPPASGGWLPNICPNCGAGLNNRMIMWMDEGAAAQCPNCGKTLQAPH